MTERRIEVPDIGDATDVGVVEVLVQPGAKVSVDQGLVVLESDKASMEVPSPAAGVVKSVALKTGDTVQKGTLIAVIEVDGVSEPVTAPAHVSSAPPPESDDDVRQQSERVEIPIARDGESRGPTRTVPPPAHGQEIVPPPMVRESKPHAAPAVRRLARELGVDLAHVPGTGPHDRIQREDVQGYVKHAMVAAGTQTGTGFAVPELPAVDFTQFGEIEVQALTKIQKLSGRNLHRSWVTIPHVTQHDEADITELEEFRKKMKADRPEVKLTLTSFFMKAVVVVMRQMPRFNASLDASGESLILKKYFHIGVAVDTPNGLVVPVIRDVDTKGLHELAIELGEVSERARARRLAPKDLQGACMTISSLGGIGGTAFTPIINPPEVAVLGVSRAAVRPVYVNGKVVPRLMCGLSLSYDHRVIDGADGARFTTRLREVLADIREMLL